MRLLCLQKRGVFHARPSWWLFQAFFRIHYFRWTPYWLGDIAYVGIRHELFFPAALTGKIEEVLRKALEATSKYKEYERILFLTPDQVKLAQYIRFPFERAGFQKVHVVVSDTPTMSGKAVIIDLG